jgi:allophanate hydrolase subunit 2
VDIVKGPDIITDPTPMGSIQIPGSGVPIILHRDAQVTGGYAKIALLCKADIDRAGQLCPGDEIRFEFVARSEALALLKKQKQMLGEAREALAV